MVVIKLLTFSLLGFGLFAIYPLVKNSNDLVWGIVFGLLGAFIGLGIGLQVLDVEKLKSQIFMSVIGFTFSFIALSLLAVNPWYGILGGVFGFIYKEFIDAYFNTL